LVVGRVSARCGGRTVGWGLCFGEAVVCRTVVDGKPRLATGQRLERLADGEWSVVESRWSVARS